MDIPGSADNGLAKSTSGKLYKPPVFLYNFVNTRLEPRIAAGRFLDPTTTDNDFNNNNEQQHPVFSPATSSAPPPLQQQQYHQLDHHHYHPHQQLQRHWSLLDHQHSSGSQDTAPLAVCLWIITHLLDQRLLSSSPFDDSTPAVKKQQPLLPALQCSSQEAATSAACKKIRPTTTPGIIGSPALLWRPSQHQLRAYSVQSGAPTLSGSGLPAEQRRPQPTPRLRRALEQATASIARSRDHAAVPREHLLVSTAS